MTESDPAAQPASVVEPSSGERTVTVDGRRWSARVAGTSAYGTGPCGLGPLEAVHFYDPDEPDRPAREALVPRGRFAQLFDVELATLFRNATPIVSPPDR